MNNNVFFIMLIVSYNERRNNQAIFSKGALTMKKVYAINGSPRRNKNTATLLDKVLEGAKEAAPEAVTERIDLYGLKYTGCVSCFACKRKDGPSYGRCALRDGLHDVLEKLRGG